MTDRAGKPPRIVWLRRDLRLSDNPAWSAAAGDSRATIPLFIDDDGMGAARALGGASRWWRGESLAAFDRSLRALGSRLVIRRGAATDMLDALIAETGADTLSFTLSRDPTIAAEEAQIVAALQARGVTVETHDANYLHDPAQLRTGSGGAFKVFTPFWNRLHGLYTPPALIPAPKKLIAPQAWPKGLAVEELRVTDAWIAPIAKAWTPGEESVRARLKKFSQATLEEYSAARDRPDLDGTSRLSPHLAWGEISVHAIWRYLQDKHAAKALPFLRQLGWRDFNMHLLADFPELGWKPWQGKFATFPAKDDRKLLRAWQRGRTGYPIVDAGLRQLWQTGWMHNRVRMIVGSFLVKDLLVPWQRGEEWFWDTLVDADLSQNAGNWQWVAGCGADAAPFFRVFNPILQGEKFDPDGTYVRAWVPELGRLPAKLIHRPWLASSDELRAADVTLGTTYPHPIVDHAAARNAALAAYKRIGAGNDALRP
ncbi:MAG TPA: deoxyribodipyrimidine photo-lyase [Dongiaceae bacterium]|nr:deoxyribodipyrimidine photo-lyase [Dongiaceae bacterium]